MCQSVLHLLSFELTPGETWFQVKSKHHSIKWKLTSSLRQLPYLSFHTRVKKTILSNLHQFWKEHCSKFIYIYFTMWLDGCFFVNNTLSGESVTYYLFKTRSIRHSKSHACLLEDLFCTAANIKYILITDRTVMSLFPHFLTPPKQNTVLRHRALEQCVLRE